MDIRVQKIVKVVYGATYLDVYLRKKNGERTCDIVDMYDLKYRSRLQYIMEQVTNLEIQLNKILNVKGDE